MCIYSRKIIMRYMLLIYVLIVSSMQSEETPVVRFYNKVRACQQNGGRYRDGKWLSVEVEPCMGDIRDEAFCCL